VTDGAVKKVIADAAAAPPLCWVSMDNRAMAIIVAELVEARKHSDEKHGALGQPPPPGHQAPLTYKDGTGGQTYREMCKIAKSNCDLAHAVHSQQWALVLTEEVMEAFAEEDPAKLRAELIQVATVCIKWIQAIDMRSKP